MAFRFPFRGIPTQIGSGFIHVHYRWYMHDHFLIGELYNFPKNFLYFIKFSGTNRIKINKKSFNGNEIEYQS